MCFWMVTVSWVLAALTMSQCSPALGQGNNPAGMGTLDPRQPRRAPKEESSRTTADVLREAGLKWPDENQKLFLAAGGGTLEEVLGLLRAGADVNCIDHASGMTPLMTVRTRAQAAVLLAAGADVNIADGSGQTALHHALFADEAEGIVNLLLACGADVNAIARGQENETLMLAARELFFEGRDGAVAERIMRTLAAEGADLDAQEVMGYTVLITSAVNNKPELTRLMVDLGANVDVRSADGLTALGWARRMGHTEVERVLIQAGAKE